MNRKTGYILIVASVVVGQFILLRQVQKQKSEYFDKWEQCDYQLTSYKIILRHFIEDELTIAEREDLEKGEAALNRMTGGDTSNARNSTH